MSAENKKIVSMRNRHTDRALRRKLKKIHDHAVLIKTEAASVLINTAIGEMVRGQGVFLGRYQPADTEGRSLEKTFNVFAAPEDLTDEAGNKATFKYIDAVKRLSQLKTWHGHKGAHYATDKELYVALEEGRYSGGWIIPPSALLMGRDAEDNETQPDNLHAHKDKGVLKDSFNDLFAMNVKTTCFSAWYWSSTPMPHIPTSMRNIRFSDGNELLDRNGECRLSCRPVRLVEITSDMKR